MDSREGFERDVRALGERIFELAGEGVPAVFDRRWWSARLLDRAMRNDELKVALFRFVDVLPALQSNGEIARHLREYFQDRELDLPSLVQWGLGGRSAGALVARGAALTVRRNIETLAERFIAGRSPEEALPSLRALWEGGTATTVDLLGEAALSESECDHSLRAYEQLIETLSDESHAGPLRENLDRGAAAAPWGAQVSVKVSSLYWKLDPVCHEASVGALVERLVPLFRLAARSRVFVTLDLEQHAIAEITREAFRRALEQPALRDWPGAGIVSQAYRYDAASDLSSLADWARARGTPVTVRLVKGAYWDTEVALAAQAGRVSPVFDQKPATDESYEICARRILESRPWLCPAFATHNVRSLAAALVHARDLEVPDDEIEVQMLYGMAEPLQSAVRGLGLRLRSYVPIGELVPGMAYLVRRLLENSSNQSFLRASFVERADRGRLLEAPRPCPRAMPLPRSRPSDATQPGRFHNEPMRDFSDPEVRHAFAQAILAADRQLGQPHKPLPLWIGGEELRTGDLDPSLDPAHPERVLGAVHRANPDEIDRAVAAAARAQPSWGATPAFARVQRLFDAAEHLRQRRDELAALEVFEVAKPWREADADVCEAIDFLEYYGRLMLEISAPRTLRHAPGECNTLEYRPRGVAAVIAPWNFPLAILSGMTAAALVTGNSVILKPAEQAPLCAWRFVEALRAAGVPPDLVQFVPGRGEVAGAALVSHPGVQLIAFTGSLATGLEIVERAAETREDRGAIARVIVELGGKNAIVIDSDADLDEAVAGVVKSAFGFAGQKCSACSRVILVDPIHDAFVSRLVEATRGLQVGSPIDPRTDVPPLIDAEQQRRVREWREIAAREGRIVFRAEDPPGGHYVGPTIVTGIEPHHRVAQEEIFGPLLSVMRASDFEHALEIANSTRFALTGGLYSRSPAHLERARQAFEVGNLYLNRPCTGALVERQPFGGFALSGIGSKAGGPDYLLQFQDTRTVTENTLRRGFTRELLS